MDAWCAPHSRSAELTSNTSKTRHQRSAETGGRNGDSIAEFRTRRPAFPEAHPTWMLVTHNAMEILFTPGRVTMLGESDGNRLRRIYTDGRPHPYVPDPTFHGHSIGHWEDDTLVVDTVHILPQVPLAISEAPGCRTMVICM
jgi:hypothetical protein